MAMTRRTCMGLGAALAATQRLRANALGLRLGIDTYTLRGLQWKAFRMIDYAKSIGLDVVQFSEFPHLSANYEEAISEPYLRRVKSYADQEGIQLEMGTWSICPTRRSFNKQYGTAEHQLGLAIRAAEILGSASVRCVMGSGELRKREGPLEKHVESTLGVFRAVRSQALDAGVTIALENHKDLRATEMRDLCDTAGKDYVGVCLDTGNPMEVLEDPLETVEVLAPYTVTSHFRDSVLWTHPRGAAFQWTAVGDGSIGIDRVIRRFAELCPNIAFNFEVITGRPPKVLPYLERDYWKGFETMPAESFARFLKLVETGHPLMAGMIIPNNDKQNAAYGAAVTQQQKVDFERSLAYVRQLQAGA